MVKQIVVILISLLNLNIFSQSIVFNNLYDYGFNYQEGAEFIIEIPDSNEYIMFTQHSNPSSMANDKGQVIYKLDEFGEILNSYYFSYFNTMMGGTGVTFTDNNIYTIGAVRDIDEGLRFDTYFLKLNYNLDSVYSKIIDIGYNDVGFKLKRLEENKMMFVSYYYYYYYYYCISPIKSRTRF